MIRKLKIKFVAIMMTIITILLVVIFAFLFYTAKTGYSSRSMDFMRTILRNEEMIHEDPRRRDPILVVNAAPDGTLNVLKNGPDIAEEQIPAIIDLASQEDHPFGELKDLYLRYMKDPSRRGNGTLYVFMDTYAEYQSLHWQLIYSALIGLGAFVILFIISVRLSDWVARPVEEAWDKQRQFVADASHELKTPLTVILANTKIIADSQEITGQKNLLRLDNIGAEAARMKLLIENMLSLARSDAGIAAAPLTPVSLSFLAEQSAATFEPIFFEAGKELSCHIQEEVTVAGDEKKLTQLIGILLDNACKYSRPGSTVSVTLSAASGRDALFTVASQGTPLAEEELKRIFDRFCRLNPSRSGIPGYGLGLSIAQSILEEHGGKIWAHSDGKETNCFSFRIPVKVEA